MGGLSEAELHVQAMRLVCEALQDREQDGIEVDWDVIRQMHDQMDAMLQALQHKHRYDSSEIVDLRKDRDHWKQARQEAIEAGELMRAEIETLRTQLDAAQAALTRERLDAEERDREIERLQAFVEKVRSILPSDSPYSNQLLGIEAALNTLDAGTEPTPVAEPVLCPERELSEEIQDAVPPTWAPLVWDLRRRLRESQQARGHALERLQAFVGKVRLIVDGGYITMTGQIDRIIEALAELDAEPTPVAELLDAEENTCP